MGQGLRGLKKTLCTPGLRNLTDTETELCLSIPYEGTGWRWYATGTEALGVAVLGMAEALLEEVAINPTTELPELTQGWEIGHTQNLVCARTQEKGAGIPQETDPDLPGSAQESPAEDWWPAARFGTLSLAVHAWDLLKEVTIIFITSTIVSPQVK